MSCCLQKAPPLSPDEAALVRRLLSALVELLLNEMNPREEVTP
jgi:hypothetical protein